MRSLLPAVLLAILPMTGTYAESRGDAIDRFASASPPYSIETVIDAYIALTAICTDRRFSRLGFTFPEAQKWHKKYVEISKDEELNTLLVSAGYKTLKVESLLHLAQDCRITGFPRTESGKKIDLEFKKLRKDEQE